MINWELQGWPVGRMIIWSFMVLVAAAAITVVIRLLAGWLEVG